MLYIELSPQITFPIFIEPLITYFHAFLILLTLAIQKHIYIGNWFKFLNPHIAKSVVKNYRPISLTSLVVKVMESIIYSNLISVLESHGKISSCQYGFRKNCSASHLLVQVVHDWAKALDSRKSSHCLFLDFAKAFDSVPHHAASFAKIRVFRDLWQSIALVSLLSHRSLSTGGD